MFAVVETGGKQIKVIPGRHIDIEKIPGEKGEKVSLSNVLMLISEGEVSKPHFQVGNPYIKGAVVQGRLVEQERDDKIIVYKMRPKKGTRKKRGHRQWYSRVFVDSIELDGKVISKTEEKPRREKKKTEEVKSEMIPEKETKQKKKVAEKKEG